MSLTQISTTINNFLQQTERWYNHPWFVSVVCGVVFGIATGLISGWLVWRRTTKIPMTMKQKRCQEHLKARLSLFRFEMCLLTNPTGCENNDSQFLRKMFSGNIATGETYESHVSNRFNDDKDFKQRFINDTLKFIDDISLMIMPCATFSNADAFMEIVKLKTWIFPESKNFVGMVFDILRGRSFYLWGINIDRCVDELFAEGKILKDYEITQQPKGETK